MNTVAAACKARAAADYARFDTFVECYAEEEWGEFVTSYDGTQMTQEAAFTLMDDLAAVWADRRSDAINSAF